MKKAVTGIGSTLVVLVFSTLCLTIFSLISLSAARIDKAMAEAEARTVTGYYEADLLAERILADIQEADVIPEELYGLSILSDGNGKVSFSCPISDHKELYVNLAIVDDSYEVLEWRMQDLDEWETDSELPVWSGD